MAEHPALKYHPLPHPVKVRLKLDLEQMVDELLTDKEENDTCISTQQN